MSERQDEIRRLWKARPRSLFLRASGAALGLMVVGAWLSGEIEVSGLLTPDHVDNLERLVTHEIIPFPLRDRPFDLAILLGWAWGILTGVGGTGLVATLAISILAICLAGLGGAVLCLSSARNLMSPEPFLPSGRPPGRLRTVIFAIVVQLTRGVQLFLRAIPEYVWVFLFLMLLGPSAWPAILALALHNAGILGKLNAEVVENLEPSTLRSLRGLGADRAQITVAAVFPLALPRFLLYFFYRYETCVREATILGMLGIVSLGYWIEEAKTALFYDEMLFLILLGACLVLAGDLASAAARRWIRRAT